MIDIGRTNELKVERVVEFGLILGDGVDEVLIPSKWVPEDAQIGDNLRVFVYTDSQSRPIATTDIPFAEVGEFACLRVVDTTEHGAFVDWGLDKDLLVPFQEQERPLQTGDKRVFFVTLHERTNRPIGSSRLSRWFEYETDGVQPKQEVSLLVCDTTEAGTMVVVNDKYRGILYANELFERVRVGDKRTGWIRHVRDDGRLDITLQPIGHAANLDARGTVLEALRQSDGFLPLHDKSDPAEIKRCLSMSKKRFKQAIGGLYKSKQIEITPDGIRLLS